MHLVDIGEKLNPATAVNKPENKKWYQRLTIDGEDFPYIAKKDAGDECLIVIKAVIEDKTEKVREGSKTPETRITLRLESMQADKKTYSLLEEEGYAAKRE
jgi:hypothetical protein